MYGNDQSGSDCDDEDLDDELGLPYVLANIGLKEKRELFQFKKTHTDVSVLVSLLLINDMLQYFPFVFFTGTQIGISKCNMTT